MATNMREQVEIKTHDQTTLRGWFYQAGSKAPVVVMSPGMPGIKEHFLDCFAERFQKAGIATLLYDHRNWGESDGLPRHHSNHQEQTQDTHDVIYYISTRSDIDPNTIALWGSSFSGGIALIAGAVDPRVKAVITQVPFVSGNAARARLPDDFLAKIYTDRGETTFLKPTYIPAFPNSLEQARTQPYAAVMSTEESWNHYQDVTALGHNKENKITLQSMFYAIRSEPAAFISQISPKPLFMTIGLHDSLIDSQLQKQVFSNAGEPKELLKLDCGYFDVYKGRRFEENISAQIAFLKKYL
ncbi:hypothetical protein GQX73_g1779 [Xylaria multiplex]|uniref:Serine aminopeptidase S33 domain-containing protein n=1 Tax=Xylaria multiplex TaxID=323545 RepID=A0A7C8MYL7_9PEZI|nr:hypothetical protein GQX73_g1779 [Xylaria multiplex]